MAGKVPFVISNETFTSEELSLPPERESNRNLVSMSIPWSKISETSSEESLHNQIQEQYMFQVDQSFIELKRIRRNREENFVQIKKTIRDKVEYMLKTVKQSIEHMHTNGTKQIEKKCEEIYQVLVRVNKLLEERVQSDRQNNMENMKFFDEQKGKIQARVEAVVNNINEKWENIEKLFVDFKEDIQQQVQDGVSRIEQNLELHANKKITTMGKKIAELRKALTNLQYLSKVS